MVVFAIVVTGDVKPLLLGALAVCSGWWTASSCPPSTAPLGTWSGGIRSRASSQQRRLWRVAPSSPAHHWAAGCCRCSAAAAFWVNAWLFAISVIFPGHDAHGPPREDAPGRDLLDAEPSSGAIGVGRPEGGDPVDPWLPDSGDVTHRRIRRRNGVLQADDRRGAIAG